MVADSPGRRVADSGRHSDLHGQFRHCLGVVSVPLIHARVAQHSRRFSLLSRCRRCACDGRQHHRRRAGGTVHPQEK